MSSNEFINEISKLQYIPQANWYNGKYIPAIQLFEHLRKSRETGFYMMPSLTSLGNKLNLFTLLLDDDVFVLLVDITPNNIPTIHWFQIEKLVFDVNDNLIDSKVILSSDDNASKWQPH